MKPTGQHIGKTAVNGRAHRALAINSSVNHDKIIIRGAKVHNLKIDYLEIPKNKFVVFTGVSGSGKSSLAFDTIYAEAERRFVESLSNYAKQFLGLLEKPDVDSIEGLSPAIAIDQHSVAKNPRSTVGTIIGIYDYLRVLFARFGQAFCPNCAIPVAQKTHQEITKEIFSFLKKHKNILLLSPVIIGKKGEYKALLLEILHSGFPKVRFDKKLYPIDELLNLSIDKNKKHTIEVLVDDIQKEDLDVARLSESVKIALKMSKGYLTVAFGAQKDLLVGKKLAHLELSEHFACSYCGFSFPKIEPRLFSFNTPYGACPECHGLGFLIKVDPDLVFPNKDLTLAEGAIRPWMNASHRVGRQSFYWWRLSELAEKYKFSLNVTVKNLSKRVINVILYGDGKEFEGVIPNLERRWRESPSEATKQEIEKYMLKVTCPFCLGKRLNKEALSIKILNRTIADVAHCDVNAAEQFIEEFKKHTSAKKFGETITLLVKEIHMRLFFLRELGLSYLTLDRESTTLSGGEARRTRLATQISSNLSGILYILDEPSAGLHPRDHAKLIESLKTLRDLRNTIIVVEHDRQTILSADEIIDLGPSAGENGGKVVFQGTLERLKSAKTLTGEYISGKKKVSDVGTMHVGQQRGFLTMYGVQENNLKNIDVHFPFGKLVLVTGVSGSGKSSLVVDTLGKYLEKHFYRAKAKPGKCKKIVGLKNIDKAIIVDQSPIGRTPRSNPATYIGIFNVIRDLFSKTHLAKMRGYTPGYFSFNVKGGRCEVCEGQGSKKVEMYFLPDAWIECEECKGTRYSSEVLEVGYQDKNISEILSMSVKEAFEFFKDIPAISSKLEFMREVGLDYLKLGQPAPTLSGGEAQRIKLAKELGRRATGRTLYILDEPTYGLHFDDIKKLIVVLKKLVAVGNTVIVIEHNPDFIKTADWIIDLGPEGGDDGGKIIAEGTISDIVKNKDSYTGKFLRQSSH